MRILVFSQHFPPEIGAGAMRASSVAEGLADRGHDVDVITCQPNYPYGVIRPEYRGSVVRRRRSGRLRVWHVWIHTRAVKTTLIASATTRRTLHWHRSPVPLPVGLTS